MDFTRLRVERDIARDGGPVLRLTGELDMSDAEALRALLRGLVGEADERLVVDLAGLQFIDSSGFQALNDGHRAAEAAGVRLLLVSPTPAVRRVAELMRMDHLALSDDRSLLVDDG